MKPLRIAAIFVGIAGATAFGSLSAATAQEFNLGIQGFNFSFDPGGVAFAYSDGYWDREHHWHTWRNEREAREYRARYQDRYDERRHDKVEHEGWREERREERAVQREEEHREERREERREEERR